MIGFDCGNSGPGSGNLKCPIIILGFEGSSNPDNETEDLNTKETCPAYLLDSHHWQWQHEAYYTIAVTFVSVNYAAFNF